MDKALVRYRRPPSSRDRMFNSFMKNAITQAVEKNASSAVANLSPEKLAEYNEFMAAMNNPADAIGIRDAELGIHVIRAVEQGDPNFYRNALPQQKGIAAAGRTSLSTQCAQPTRFGVRAMRQRRPV